MNPLRLEQDRPRPILAMAQTAPSEDGFGKTDRWGWPKFQLFLCPPPHTEDRALPRPLAPSIISISIQLLPLPARLQGPSKKGPWVLCLHDDPVEGAWGGGIFSVMKSGPRKRMTTWVIPANQALYGWRQLWKQVRQVTWQKRKVLRNCSWYLAFLATLHPTTQPIQSHKTGGILTTEVEGVKSHPTNLKQTMALWVATKP